MFFNHLYGFRSKPSRPRETPRTERPRTLHARMSGRGAPSFPPFTIPALILIAGAVIVGGVAYGARAAGRHLCVENSRFTLREVVLPANLPLLSREMVLEKAGIAPGDNLFARTPEQIRDGLLSVHAIKSASVSRQLPDRIDINLTVREPVARVGSNNGYSFIVDTDGLVFTLSARHRTLPLILGVDPTALEVGKSVLSEASRDAFEVLRVVETKGWQDILPLRIISIGHPEFLDLRLGGGQQIKILRAQIETGLKNAATALQRNKELGVRHTMYTATAVGSMISTP